MIVVTGAAGFIGSNIVADLELAGRDSVAAVDWFENGDKWRNLAKRTLAGVVAPEQARDYLAAHAGKITAVVHMGAISSTMETDVDRLVRQNIQDTVFYWDWCAQHQVPYIYASSAATYGEGELGYGDDNAPDKLAALRPLNAYGWSKKAADQIFVARAAAGQACPPQWVGLKFFNVYGPNEYHKGNMKSVAATMFETIKGGSQPRLFKSYRDGIAHGDQRRDFIYVKDCSRAILWYLDHPQVSGIFNLGTGHARSFLDMANALGRAMDHSLNIAFIEMPDALREKYQYFTQAEMSKSRAHGMDFAFTSLEDGIADYARNYLSQADRYR